MKTIAVLGATGMVGSTVVASLSKKFSVVAVCRQPIKSKRLSARLGPCTTVEIPDLFAPGATEHLLEKHSVDVVVNCAGLNGEPASTSQAVASLKVNALLPHHLAEKCAAHSAYFIHLSTDGVFSGKSGNYREVDQPDDLSFYGRAKALGEPLHSDALIVRTSLVGFSADGQGPGLLDWAKTQQGKTVQGYSNYIFSGMTAFSFGDCLDHILHRADRLTGVYHVAGPTISKAELLRLCSDVFDWKITIEDVRNPQCDRRLIGHKFEAALSWHSTDWLDMLRYLKGNTAP